MTTAQADLSYLFGADGELQDRFLPVEKIFVPEVELSDDGLQLKVTDHEAYFYGAGRPATVNARCLLGFVQLADATAGTILRFGQKWGLLGLCEHGEPAAGHGLRPREARLSGRVSFFPTCQVAEAEGLEDWRRYAARFGAVIKLAGDLGQATVRSDSSELWAKLQVPARFLAGAKDIERQKQLLASHVNNAFLGTSTIQPVVKWDKQPTLQFGCHGGTRLFAALAFELALTVADCKIAFCSYCHRPYEPRRRPHEGEANSCESCRQRANAQRVRRCRDRKRAAVRRSKDRTE